MQVLIYRVTRTANPLYAYFFLAVRSNHIVGVRTIQGFLAYYYNEEKRADSVELNRCRFNQIAENPRRSTYSKNGLYPRGTPTDAKYGYSDMDCRDGRENCDDEQCQTWPISESYILHYTYCKFPSGCPNAVYNETLKDNHCRKMRREWFLVRKLVAEENNQPIPTGEYFPEIYQGFCQDEGKYITK